MIESSWPTRKLGLDARERGQAQIKKHEKEGSKRGGKTTGAKGEVNTVKYELEQADFVISCLVGLEPLELHELLK